MRIALSVAALGSLLALGQPAPASIERGTLRLHYVQKPIGYERYEVTPDGERSGRSASGAEADLPRRSASGAETDLSRRNASGAEADAVKLTADFDFTDRGGRVQLAATLRAKGDFTPISFQAKGKSYRFVNVDSDVRVEGSDAVVRADGAVERRVTLPSQFFTVDGYAPFSAQMLLLRYWKRHGRPRVLRTVPGQPTNDVFVEARGREAIRIGEKVTMLERFAIDGVVWGRETLWLDEGGSLAAAITRAGGLSFEAVREDLEPALVQFVQRATRDWIADLESITRVNAPLKSGAYAMVGATIVDGTNRPPVPDGVVLVRDGRIADAGPRAAVTVPDGVPTVDVSGKTLVPGLWDMHTHVTQIEWAPVYLASGVTTVRDMGNEFEFITVLRDAIASKRALGPRLLLAGLVDGPGPNAFGVYYAATPDEAKQAVGRYHDAGFQQIKIYSLITPPLVEAICAEAHRLGMTVTGHVPNGMTIDQAAKAGMDQIAHLAIRGEAGSDEVNRIIGVLRDRKTVIDPTQSWNELLGHAAGTPIAAFQPGVEKIPPPLNRLFSNAGTAGIDAAAARARLERGLRIVKALHEAGVPVVAGTDEGIPGHSVHREIELYVEAGLTPLQALQAATIVPARAMKLDADLGTIEKGKRADIVVLNANPLERIQNIRSARWTIVDGRVYDTQALWRSVRFQP